MTFEEYKIDSLTETCTYLGVLQKVEYKGRATDENLKVTLTTCLYGYAEVTESFILVKGVYAFLIGTNIIVGTIVQKKHGKYLVFMGTF